jgi:hypothetical protein
LAAELVAVPTAARAEGAAADLSSVFSPLMDRLNGTLTNFYLYSNMTAPRAIGPNNDSFIRESPPGGGTRLLIKPIPVDPVTRMNFGKDKNGKDIIYDPIVSARNIVKPTNATGQQAARDTSGFMNGDRFIGTLSSGFIDPPANGAHFASRAFWLGGATGRAAAITDDPGQLTGPASGYFVLNSTDNGVEHHEYLASGTIGAGPGGFAAVEFMAIDSRFEPNPSDLGDPSNYLWLLRIAANGPVADRGDLDVSFQINPLATKADVLTDAYGDPLSTGAVLSRVLGALTVSGGQATLSPVDPFPVGTEYHVPSGTTITYGAANGAAIISVPEPSSLLLLVTGALSATWFLRRSGRSRGFVEGPASGRPRRPRPAAT